MPSPAKIRLVAPPAVEDDVLFADPGDVVVERLRVGSPRVVGTSSRVLFDVLARVYDDLGFAAVGDGTLRDLVIARIVEPTSILDTGRVLTDLGQSPANERTMRRTLGRAQQRGYRDIVAAACFNHALSSGDVSLCLHDVTTLYFEAEKEDEGEKGCARSATPRNDASTRRSWSACWSIGTGSRSRSAASRATKQRR